MLWKAIFIFTITLCIIDYPNADTIQHQLALAAIASLNAAALIDSRGRVQE